MLGSLKSRLALSNLAISLVALVVLTFVFGQVLLQRTIDSDKGFVQQEASRVQLDMEKAFGQAFRSRNRDIGGLYQRIKKDSRLFNKQVVLFSGAGTCAYDSTGTTFGRDHTNCHGPENWRVDPTDTIRPASGLVEHGSRSYYVVQMPTGHGSVVALIAPAGQVIPSLSVLAPGFLLAVLAAALIWVAMAIFFGYSVGRPLAKVSAASRAIAAGDYNRTVDVSSHGEIGELGSSFNHMVTQVRLTNEMMKDFVANVSHDLRTPITVISGFAGSIMDGTMSGSEETKEAAGIIASEARRMEHLVDDLLQLTRLESGLKRFDHKPVDIAGLARRSIQRALAASPGRTVTSELPRDLPLAWGDEESLERVLMNLLNNALAYTPEPGRIVVSAARTGEWITVNIADTGPGIAAADQSRIFERFFRVDKSRTGGDGHSGLGLPIVKEIVESHGGSVNVISEPGRGSTFTFTVPVSW